MIIFINTIVTIVTIITIINYPFFLMMMMMIIIIIVIVKWGWCCLVVYAVNSHYCHGQNMVSRLWSSMLYGKSTSNRCKSLWQWGTASPFRGSITHVWMANITSPVILHFFLASPAFWYCSLRNIHSWWNWTSSFGSFAWAYSDFFGSNTDIYQLHSTRYSNLTGWCFEPLWKIWVSQLGWLDTQY